MKCSAEKCIDKDELVVSCINADCLAELRVDTILYSLMRCLLLNLYLRL